MVERMGISGRAVCLLAMLLVSGTSTFAFPGNEPTVSVDVEAARQLGPLQIVGFKMPTESGDVPVVVLRNLSSCATDSIWFRVRVACATPSSTSEPQPHLWELEPRKTPQDSHWPHESVIPPGVQGEAHLEWLLGFRLILAGETAGCSCLRASVRVTHVKFADGADWDATRATNSDPQPLNAVSEENIQPCRESPESAKLLKEVTGAGFHAGIPTRADDTLVRAYSVTCALQQRDGKWLALCPM